MKLAVIVARFQNSMLTAGHQMLINHCKAHADKVLIVIGHSPVRLAYKNPLSLEVRRDMLHELYIKHLLDEKIHLTDLPDHKYDNIWSQDLDNVILDWNFRHEFKDDEITLYGSRDSFIPKYTGMYKTQEVDFGIPHVSSTADREIIHKRMRGTTEWREGIIYGSNDKYPVSYQTVDMAILKRLGTTDPQIATKLNWRPTQVLLARKRGYPNYCFIGGFVDVTDHTLEGAAIREAMEECGPEIYFANTKYLCSRRIDDWRYRHEKDKIMTALFVADYTQGEAIASDDVQEVKWFDVDELTNEHIEPEHHCLLNALKKHLK